MLYGCECWCVLLWLRCCCKQVNVLWTGGDPLCSVFWNVVLFDTIVMVGPAVRGFWVSGFLGFWRFGAAERSMAAWSGSVWSCIVWERLWKTILTGRMNEICTALACATGPWPLKRDVWWSCGSFEFCLYIGLLSFLANTGRLGQCDEDIKYCCVKDIGVLFFYCAILDCSSLHITDLLKYFI